MDDINAGSDVGESMRSGEQSLALELLVQIPMCSSIQCEWGTKHEGAQIVVLVKIRDTVLQFIGVKERLHISQLDVCL